MVLEIIFFNHTEEMADIFGDIVGRMLKVATKGFFPRLVRPQVLLRRDFTEVMKVPR